MIGQRIGISSTLVGLTVVLGTAMAGASPDFAERKDSRFQPPQGVAHASVEPAAQIPETKAPLAETPDAETPEAETPKAETPVAAPDKIGAGDRRRRAAGGRANEVRHPWRPHRTRWSHRADPIDVVAARAKVVRDRLRTRVWLFTYRRF